MGIGPSCSFCPTAGKDCALADGSPGKTHSILHWRLPPSICPRWNWRIAHHLLFEQTLRQQSLASSLKSEWSSLARVSSSLGFLWRFGTVIQCLLTGCRQFFNSSSNCPAVILPFNSSRTYLKPNSTEMRAFSGSL